MNMKKTIAAVAAGAVAVSAMATTVSALEAYTLNYNLVKSIKKDDAAGTVTATFTNVQLEANGEVVIEAIGAGGYDCIVTVSGSFWDDNAGANKTFVPVVATQRSWEAGWSVEGAALWKDGKIHIPVVGAGTGTNVALRSSSNAIITVKVDYKNLPESVTGAGDLNGLIAAGSRGIRLTSLASASSSVQAGVVYKVSGATASYIAKKDAAEVEALAAKYKKLKFVAASNKWVEAGEDAKIEVTSCNLQHGTAPMTDKSKITVYTANAPAGKDTGTYTLTWNGTDFVDASLTSWGDGATAASSAVVDTSGATLAVGDTIAVSFTKATADGIADLSADVYKAVDFFNAIANGDTLEFTAATATNGAIYASGVSGAATETSANSVKKMPYHSSLQNTTITNFNQGWYDSTNKYAEGDKTEKYKYKYVGSGNVLTWIGYATDTDATWSTQEHMTASNAAMSVINDCVQKYSDVVFTFNTAPGLVVIEKDATGNILDYYYGESWMKVQDNTKDGDIYKTINDYSAFGRHYWDKDTGYGANTTYIYNDWLGNNLFEGALVVNNNLTLSLAATDKFDWTSTSLSFSWDAIQDAAMTQNQYANYIQTMVLRTSTDWFWDNMTVTLGAVDEEDVGTTSPVEAEEDEIEEEVPEIEEEPEDEPEEEPEEEPEDEPEETPAPAPIAESPKTGNAPVALAVIPVALAAAAVVAKKRG